jgi:hypothetical protein
MAASSPHIEGVYELGHVLHVLDADSHGFARTHIEQVECFWTFGDMHGSQAGFVLRLHDGRRAHIAFAHWHAYEQDEDFRIDVTFLPADVLPDPGEGTAWIFETAHLGRRLAAAS